MAGAERILARLRHIEDAVRKIEAYTAGKTFDAYRADPMLADAVERNLERISEASRHIPEELQRLRPEIPWRQVADIGNVLRHGYDRVSDLRVWQVVTDDLPPLARAVSALIEQLGSTGSP